MINKNCKNYLKQAYSNERLVLFLDKNCSRRHFHKWILVVMYYAALHLFYAFLEDRGDSIPRIHKSNDKYSGDINEAINKFYTSKNDITAAVGSAYKQLFEWSYDIRYNPDNAKLLGNRNVKEGLKILEMIKIVTFNEVGYMPKPNVGKGRIEIERVNSDNIKSDYERLKKDN